jgi:surfactin synthase thioesterase subunit
VSPTDSAVRGGTWVRRYHSRDAAAVRLVCFPHAGGSASYYFPVSAALSPDVDVLAVQYPGRQDRHSEPCVDSVPALADAVVAHLDEWRDRPLALFGHSLGASVAFEVARRLEDTGPGPTDLFVSGRRAPSAERDERIHQRDDAGLVDAIRELAGTDPRMLDDPEVVRMILPSVRADYRAAERYRCAPDAVLRCPVHVLTGDADKHVTAAEARAWERHSSGPVTVSTYPGGHFFLNEHAAEVIGEIRRILVPG